MRLFGNFVKGAGRLIGHAGSALRTVGGHVGNALRTFAESGAAPVLQAGLGLLGQSLHGATGGASSQVASALTRGIDHATSGRAMGAAAKVVAAGNAVKRFGAGLQQTASAGPG
jgi:hypothetical protein